MSANCTKEFQITVGSGALMAYWPFEETTDTGNRIDKVQSIPLAAFLTTWTGGGKIDNATRQPVLNAILQTIGAPPELAYTGNGISLFGWVRIVSAGPTDVVQLLYYQFGTGGINGHILLEYDNSTQLLLASLFPTPITAGINVNLDDSAFHFFVVWYDNATQRLNLQVDNGAVTTSGGTFAVVAQGSGRFEVQNFGPADYIIDEYGISNEVYSAGRRAALFNSNNGVTWPAVAAI